MRQCTVKGEPDAQSVVDGNSSIRNWLVGAWLSAWLGLDRSAGAAVDARQLGHARGTGDRRDWRLLGAVLGAREHLALVVGEDHAAAHRQLASSQTSTRTRAAHTAQL